MGAGLSMASVNKIKELAGQREYGLALEIVDGQDLSKSLNPQFLRLCGDIYIYAGRYKDARRLLVMAHRLGPESKRVICSLMKLHLKAGHEELAKKYYEIYLFGADDSVETKQVKYLYDNAYGKPADELIQYLEASYMHNMDYDWSFVTYLLLVKLGRSKDAEALSDIYSATFKTGENIECMKKVASGEANVDDLIYTFAKEWVEDDAEDEKEIREQELALLAEDELRMHPKEAEITIIFDEIGDGVELSKRKMKKLLKENEKLERELEEKERLANEQSEASDAEAGENPDGKKPGLFKKLFKKSKATEETDETAEIEVVSEDKQTNEASEHKEEKDIDTASVNEAEKTDNTEVVSENTEAVAEVKTNSDVVVETNDIDKANDNVEISKASEESNTVSTDDTAVTNETDNTKTDSDESKTAKYKFNIEDAELVDETVEDIIDEDNGHISGEDNEVNIEDETSIDWDKADDGEENMRELHFNENGTKRDVVISVDDDTDEFAAEAENVEELSGDADYNASSENVNSEKNEQENFFSKKKMEYVFEAADIIIDDDEQEDVDDFSVSVDDEFGAMSDDEYDVSTETEENTETEEYEEKQEEIQEVIQEEKTEEPHFEETELENTETEDDFKSEEETDFDDNFEFDFDYDKEIKSKAEKHEAEETKPEEVEELVTEKNEPEEVEEFATEETEPEKVEESVIDETKPEKVEEFAIEETESEKVEEVVAEETESEQVEEFIIEETEPEEVEEVVAEETEPEQVEEVVTEEVEPEYGATEKSTSLFDSLTEKKNNLDYPVFKTDLFPEYNVVEVENNFDEIMEKAQDKMQENLKKEEQMQREAEALLASLGIDLGNVNPKKEMNTATYKNEKQTVKTISRDELKGNLKISPEKRELIRKIKEHR